MTWANVDDLFPEHPKVLAAGGDAGWLYICGLCFTNRNLTEGRVPKAVVPRLSDRKNPTKLAKTLVDVGLWHDQGDHYLIHDWEKYNESADDVKARKEHARNAARARWSGKGKPPTGSAQPMPGAMPGALGEHPPSTMLDPDRAMPSHSSPNQSSSSVVNHQVAAPPPPDDEDDSREAKAKAIVADRRIEALTTPPANRRAYRAKVLRDINGELGDEMARLAGTGLSAEAIADAVEPRSVVGPSPYPEAGMPSEPVWAEVTDEHGHLVVVPRLASA